MNAIIRNSVKILETSEKVVSNINEYQEEDNGSFTNDGKEYNLNSVLKAVEDLPNIVLFVEDLIWILDEDSSDDPNFDKRVEEAELKYPILVTYYEDKIVVLDGLHRLAKALKMDKKYISGKFVTDEVLLTAQQKTN